MKLEDVEKQLPVTQRVKYHPEKELWIIETVITQFLNKNFMRVVKENAEKQAQEKK